MPSSLIKCASVKLLKKICYRRRHIQDNQISGTLNVLQDLPLKDLYDNSFFLEITIGQLLSLNNVRFIFSLPNVRIPFSTPSLNPSSEVAKKQRAPASTPGRSRGRHRGSRPEEPDELAGR